MDLLYSLAEVFVGFMDSRPPLLAAFACLFIAGVPVTLLHELGHAVAARVLLDTEVQVTVGNAGRLADVRLGQVAVALNALSRPDRAQGLAEFDASRLTARGALLIALAGPAASLGGTVLTGWALAAGPGSGVVHDLLWAATLVGVFGVCNLVPLTIEQGRGGPAIRSDGRLALDALRVLHELR